MNSLADNFLKLRAAPLYVVIDTPATQGGLD
jgi:hypothetical protein